MEVTLPLNEMTLAEKLRLMETLWDDLTRNHEEMEPPAWHLDVLQERRRLAEAGLETYSDWEDVKTRLRKLYE